MEMFLYDIGVGSLHFCMYHAYVCEFQQGQEPGINLQTLGFDVYIMSSTKLQQATWFGKYNAYILRS